MLLFVTDNACLSASSFNFSNGIIGASSVNKAVDVGSELPEYDSHQRFFKKQARERRYRR